MREMVDINVELSDRATILSELHQDVVKGEEIVSDTLHPEHSLMGCWP